MPADGEILTNGNVWPVHKGGAMNVAATDRADLPVRDAASSGAAIDVRSLRKRYGALVQRTETASVSLSISVSEQQSAEETLLLLQRATQEG